MGMGSEVGGAERGCPQGCHREGCIRCGGGKDKILLPWQQGHLRICLSLVEMNKSLTCSATLLPAYAPTSVGVPCETDGRSRRLAIRDSADWIAASMASLDSASLTTFRANSTHIKKDRKVLNYLLSESDSPEIFQQR